ncbi:DUF2628 domain-containing protein [Siccirubricoccus sp. G192]|uniref:DUF2628 domain-containing protein n=1 Tax=Siccirubricoccus sp. G192 TaxID=2849651 RepID=UPI001C2C58D8|nr:DUF2628 domain-containing protein [Siccirubricoccus sp. G192]MBV1796966.1 DUF2628 domain-containing protein [Siccirubricoccus sp. G192]
MRVWTVHAPAAASRRARPPVLVPEGFSWGAFLFALPWLLLHRLWLEALIYVAAVLLLVLLLPPPAGPVAAVALQFLLGAHAQDLRRRALARRGYAQPHVVVAPNADLALARLLDARPDLAGIWAQAALGRTDLGKTGPRRAVPA